jgi:hypothetical protein
MQMRRIQIEVKRTGTSVSRRDRNPVLPLDARDPAILRAKRLLREAHHGPGTAIG